MQYEHKTEEFPVSVTRFEVNSIFADMLDAFAWRRIQSTWTWHTKPLSFQGS